MTRPHRSSGATRADTRFTKALRARVLRYAHRHRLTEPGERALVAVSGGQDSLALLLILDRLAKEMDIGLAVAHFDHRLRSPEEAWAEAASVRRLAGELGLPFASGSGDVRARARRRRESLEEAARHMRYAFLKREARRLNCGVVALGHTRDDRVETVLLHLLRGSGLDGLVGLRPRSSWPFGRGPAVIRPLLEVTRAETLRYCRQAGVEPHEDPTNLSLEATRNRIRHELLPSLRRFNPRLDEALCRLGDAAAGATDYLDDAAAGAWWELARVDEGAVAFPRRRFASLPPPLRVRLLRRAVRRLVGPTADLEGVHIGALEESLRKSRSAVSLPHGLTVRVGAGEVRVGAPSPTRPIPETALTVPGRTAVPGWTVTAEVVAPPSRPRPRTRFEAWLDADAIGLPVVIRSRRAGDRMRPLGLGGERKLQDILVDDKVPAEERDTVPMVCAPWGVAWVVGHRLDERAALREGSERALRLRFRRAGKPLTGRSGGGIKGTDTAVP